MNRPDPLQHMMTWGAVSSGIVLMLYFLITGNFAPSNFDPLIIAVIAVGIFVGFTLGGMTGTIIGAIFRHNQEIVDITKLRKRRNIVLLSVFLPVWLVLTMFSFGIFDHPITLSLIGALTAALASKHYLQRMENWLLTQEKPKRKIKNEDRSGRLVQENHTSDNQAINEHDTNKNHYNVQDK